LLLLGLFLFFFLSGTGDESSREDCSLRGQLNKIERDINPNRNANHNLEKK
jgi:hypothetical protein